MNKENTTARGLIDQIKNDCLEFVHDEMKPNTKISDSTILWNYFNSDKYPKTPEITKGIFKQLANKRVSEALEELTKYNTELSGENRRMDRLIHGLNNYIQACKVADKDDPHFKGFEESIAYDLAHYIQEKSTK